MFESRLSRHRRGSAIRRAGFTGAARRPRTRPVSRRLRRGDPAPAIARRARVSRARACAVDPRASRSRDGASGAHCYSRLVGAERRDRNHRQRRNGRVRRALPRRYRGRRTRIRLSLARGLAEVGSVAAGLAPRRFCGGASRHPKPWLPLRGGSAAAPCLPNGSRHLACPTDRRGASWPKAAR